MTTGRDRPRDGTLNARNGLSVKITGIVFWGLVLIGLLTAVAVLHGDRRTILSRDGHLGSRLTRRLTAILRRKAMRSSAQEQKAVQRLFQSWQTRFAVQALWVQTAHHIFRFGHAPAGALILTEGARSVARPQTASWTQVRVAFPSPSLAVTRARDHLMLSLGLIMMAFGLVLQIVLQRMLSRPFASLVTAAERFSEGDTRVRMDAQLPGEFGFLATFINSALDSWTKQQSNLRAALSRAALSEAELSIEKERAELTLHAISDAVVTINIDGLIQYINPAAERLTGWTRKHAVGEPLERVVCLRDEATAEVITNPGYQCLFTRDLQTLRKNTVLLRLNNEACAIELSAAAMCDHSDDIVGAVIAFQDVSHARQLAQQLSYQASHDALTGLLNRLQFEKSVEDLIYATQKTGVTHTLLYLDMDQFKIVNDTCGHIAGDTLLRQLAGLLRADLRKDDILARLGGDEFGIALVDCDLEHGARMAESLRQHVRDYRFSWQSRVFSVGVSIGVVAITPDVRDINELLSAADLSCYAAKDQGRDRVHVYCPSDADLARRHGDMQWANVIADALKNDGFVLYKQTIRAIKGSDTIGERFEILLRIKGLDGTLIGPSQFLPAAERYDLMLQIDRWVIQTTFEALSRKSASSACERMVSINLSGASLGDEHMLGFIHAAALRYAISLKTVCFEITEANAISNLALARVLIADLTAVGCRFSLDDFGSGVSSFGYLKTLPVSFLKIDGHFLQNIHNDPVDRSIVEAISHMARSLNIQTIAEWVENERILDVLAQIGVDFVQGNHIGLPEPLSVAAFDIS